MAILIRTLRIASPSPRRRPSGSACGPPSREAIAVGPPSKKIGPSILRRSRLWRLNWSEQLGWIEKHESSHRTAHVEDFDGLSSSEFHDCFSENLFLGLLHLVRKLIAPAAASGESPALPPRRPHRPATV